MLAAVSSTAAIPKRTRIFVVEEQALFGKALCQLLSSEPTFDVLGDVQRLDPADPPRIECDLIVLDLNGPSIDYIDEIVRCRELFPRSRICVLSTQVRPEIMQRCIGVGADAYLVKDVSPSELIRAVKIVAKGENYVDPRIAGSLLRRRFTPEGRAADELSDRESDVVRLIAQGMSNKEIGAKLCLSEKTVKNHISRIFSKLNINARAQAVVYALRTGMV
jgi:DNA-binding NarL/FixJ family response regulator